ncbi:MAG: Bax inhibitor-1/YccA family protein [Pseudomonadota bacterium]
MADRYSLNSNLGSRTAGTQARAGVDAGLRKYMIGVYNYMTSGVLLTGVVSLLTFMWVRDNIEAAQLIYGSGLKYVIMFAPLAFIMVMSFGMNKLSSGALQGLFWAFAGVMGVSLSSIFMVYTGTSIAKTFFITAATFGSLSLWGYTTKKDLSGFGTFLFMGLVGLIIASVVNLFLGSDTLGWVISLVGVGLFAGLTAYDTQRIREMYYMTEAGEARSKTIIMGALTLYLDFINLFLYLLRFLGNRE